MTVLPDLERQLVKAAATVASAPGAPERRAPSMLVTRGRWARRRLALAVSVVPVLAVVAAILSTRGADHTGTAGSSPSPALGGTAQRGGRRGRRDLRARAPVRAGVAHRGGPEHQHDASRQRAGGEEYLN